jgi:rhamnopyranosyl-N-acetylglucosaminyl-diphospho-decaprenol beta-1,3/1,4-galactofuranosyltransferase
LRTRVYAVVVTYNRKEILAGCLDALLAQSYPVERILVTDNASTDGTREYLTERGYLAQAVISYICLPENRGGAGGFHEGFKHAMAENAEWVWAMDDDGLAHRETLEHLLRAPEAAGAFRGPVVLTREEIDDPQNDQLAFPGGVERRGKVVPLRTRREIEALAQDGVLRGYASVFNGVLIKREAIQQLGLPDPRFFIWGDEWDYFLRAREAGIEPTTVTRALYWHPLDRAPRTTIRLGPLSYDVPHGRDRLRNYLMIRNHAYLARRYRGWIAWIRHTIKYLLYHRTPAGCFTPSQVLRYSWEGMTGRFAGRGDFA